MATGFWSSLAQRVVSRSARPGVCTADPGEQADRSTGLRLVGEPQLLNRLVSVRPGTVAVVFRADGLRLQLPGELLRPRLRPLRDPTWVVVVNTAPVSLEVSIDSLPTLDGFALEAAVIRLTVQLTHDQQERALLELANEAGTDLESRLLEQVQHEVVRSARAAVGMNRLAHIGAESLTGLLSDHWLPQTFAAGLLVRHDVTVLSVVRPGEPGVPEPAEAPAEDQGAGFALHLDADLARLWREHTGSVLHGISGAQVLSASTVVAVPATEPGAYESSRLQEAFGRYFTDRQVHLITAPASSYPELVRSWFAHVDANPSRLVAVESTRPDLLRITVDPVATTSPSSDQGFGIGSPADRKALRRLIPHERIVFAAAETGS